ncbi:MAG TPA: AraC family transcriptional regulator [Candidatus Caccousia avicola]|uniref:AraC family transcriptional regulator n=1 Tax=Candidatus Caccousia avicola TaxID=2840721 RepID=A0A9D1AML7_9FIRM|nr:AraC family transcriptional regulator [Candidatus Caccousia avicola]
MVYTEENWDNIHFLKGALMRYLAAHERAARGTFDFPIELYHVDISHPRYEMPFHWHMEAELLFVLEGELALSVEGTEYAAHPGDCFFLPGGAIHGGSPDHCVYECLVFDMDRFLPESAVCRRKYAAALGDGSHIRTHLPANSRAAQVALSLFFSMEKEQPGYEFVTTGLLWQFFGLIVQEKLFVPDSEESRIGRQRADQMKSVLRRIRRDYASPLTLDELAAEAGMNPRYFCRVFRQMTGRTPIDYLNYYRIECAAELLCTEGDSVTDVALACGFNDPGYFARLFRRHKGMSAAAYRRQYGEYIPHKEEETGNEPV